LLGKVKQCTVLTRQYEDKDWALDRKVTSFDSQSTVMLQIFVIFFQTLQANTGLLNSFSP